MELSLSGKGLRKHSPLVSVAATRYISSKIHQNPQGLSGLCVATNSDDDCSEEFYDSQKALIFRGWDGVGSCMFRIAVLGVWMHIGIIESL